MLTGIGRLFALRFFGCTSSGPCVSLFYYPNALLHFRPTEDAYSSGHLVLSHLGLAFVLILRPFFPELVMSTDLLSFEHPSVLLFCFFCNTLNIFFRLGFWPDLPPEYFWVVFAFLNANIKKTRTAMLPDTGKSDMAGVPRLVLRDITKLSAIHVL